MWNLEWIGGRTNGEWIVEAKMSPYSFCFVVLASWLMSKMVISHLILTLHYFHFIQRAQFFVHQLLKSREEECLVQSTSSSVRCRNGPQIARHLFLPLVGTLNLFYLGSRIPCDSWIFLPIPNIQTCKSLGTKQISRSPGSSLSETFCCTSHPDTSESRSYISSASEFSRFLNLFILCGRPVTS